MFYDFKINQRYTFIYVGVLAQSVRSEIIITRKEPSGEIGYRHIKERKQYVMPGIDTLKHYLIFDGHDLPVVLDTDTDAWQGNARINFIENQPDDLHDFILHNNLKSTFENLSILTYSSPDKNVEAREYAPLFPEYPIK